MQLIKKYSTGETGYWVWVAKLEDETRRCPWKLLCVEAPFYSCRGISSSRTRLIKASPHWNHSLQQASSWWLRQVRRSWIQHQQLLQWPLSHSCETPTSTCKGTCKGQERRESPPSKTSLWFPSSSTTVLLITAFPDLQGQTVASKAPCKNMRKREPSEPCVYVM